MPSHNHSQISSSKLFSAVSSYYSCTLCVLIEAQWPSLKCKYGILNQDTFVLVQREKKDRESAAFLGETVVLFVLQPEAIIKHRLFFFFF